MKWDCNKLWKDKWHPWFAWFPVHTSWGCYWLETIERQRYSASSCDGAQFYRYRPKGTEK